MKLLNQHISQNILRSTVAALAVAVFSVVAYYLYKLNFDQAYDNRWAIADWLINYEDGGFKRRGLTGTISFFIQDITGFALQQIVFFSQLLIFSLFLIYLVKGVFKRHLELLDLSLLLTPWALLVYLNSSVSYTGRKEIILLFIFAYFIYHLQSKSLTSKRAFLVKIMLALSVLAHEITFFYIPYFIFALYISEGRINYKESGSYLASVLIPLVAITFLGGDINQGQTYEIVASRGLILDMSGTMKHADTVWALDYITGFWEAYGLYPISLSLGILHFWYFLKTKGSSKLNAWFVFLSAALLFTMPLFLLALDWGRWIHIHFMMLITLSSLMINKNSAELSNNSYRIQGNVIACTIIIFSLFFKMDHCGYGFHPGGLFERITSIIN